MSGQKFKGSRVYRRRFQIEAKVYDEGMRPIFKVSLQSLDGGMQLLLVFVEEKLK